MGLGRREFLMVSGGVLVGLGALSGCSGAAGLGPAAVRGAVAAATGGAPAPAQSAAKATGRSLVIIYLAGGNDGLNTVAPYGMGQYYDLRPTLAVKEQDALPLAGKLGLHPNLKGLKALYDAGQVAIVQGVGYPNPDRSHFRSFDIWATAQTQGISPVGWLGRYLDLNAGGSTANPLRAVAVGAGVPKPLLGAKGTAIAMESLDTMQIKGDPRAAGAIKAMYGAGGSALTVVRGRGQAALAAADAVKKLAAGYTPGVQYPKGGLASSLQLMVKLLAGGAGSEVLYTTFGGFDEHAGEKLHHDRLLAEFDGALSAFQQDLAAHGLADRVLTFVHSEFGRRAKENGNGGTDHGAAAASFLIGGAVKGGLVGDHPSLTDLQDGDLKAAADFRSIYATLLERWLKAPAEPVLGAKYAQLPLLAAT